MTPQVGLSIQLSGLPKRLRHGKLRLKLTLASLGTPLGRAIVTISFGKQHLHVVADGHGRAGFRVTLPKGRLKIVATFPGGATLSQTARVR